MPTNSAQPATPPQAPPAHLLGVLRSLWTWRMPIVYVTAAGAVLSVIVSLLLPNYFTGSTSFLAISPDQSSIDGIFGTSNARLQFYGNGDDIDRLMAVAESDELVDFIVDSFHLYFVYDIDSTKQKAPLYVRREFLGNYAVTKTSRDAIELEIDDRDPQRAAAMVRAAREKINRIALDLIHATQARSAAGLRGEITERERTLEELNGRITALREKYGVYDTNAQSEALANRYATMEENVASTSARIRAYRQRGGRVARDSIAKLEVELAGIRSAKINLDSQLVRLNTSLGPIVNLQEERAQLNKSLSEDRIRLKQFETILRSEQRALEVVEEAKVPVAKSKPRRSLIVLGATVLSFLFAAVGAILIDTGRQYDWESIIR